MVTLTLLDKSANIAAKNKDFIEKKEYYEESDYKVTSSIVEALTTAINTGNDARRTITGSIPATVQRTRAFGLKVISMNEAKILQNYLNLPLTI